VKPPRDVESRDSRRYAKWRTSVFKRDKYRCANCGKKGDLEAHHINSFADNVKGRFERANGITLCRVCHELFHKLYGKGGNNRYQLQRFLSKKRA